MELKKRPKGERGIGIVIGENIQRYSKENHVAISTLRKELNATTTRMNKILSGEIGMNIWTVQKIAWVLNVTTIDLMEDWGV